MAVSAYATGTQTCTVGTEHYLSSPNAAGVYTLHVDIGAMGADDAIVIRIYQKVLTAGTVRKCVEQGYSGTQSPGWVVISMPIANELAETNALRFSIEQQSGDTGRAFPWKVLTY